MLVAGGPGADKLPAPLPFPLPRLPCSDPSPDSEVDVGGLSSSLSPPTAAGKELLVVAAVTTDVDGTEPESPSRRTYALTNPVELNFGRHIGSHDAEAELL